MRAVASIVKLVFKEIFRKKDFYVAFMLVGVILFFASRMNFYDTPNITRYLSEMGLALIFLFSVVLTVPLAARQYPSETRDRTLAVLLSKPVSRAQFILGKFFGSCAAGIACFAIFYGVFLAIVQAHAGKPFDASSAAAYAQGGVMFAAAIAVLAAMATALSFFLTMPANLTLTLAVYILMTAYGADIRHSLEGGAPLGRALGDAVYFTVPHFEFFDLRQRMVHEWGPLGWGVFGGVLLYAAAYVGIFLAIAYAKFRRQNL